MKKRRITALLAAVMLCFGACGTVTENAGAPESQTVEEVAESNAEAEIEEGAEDVSSVEIDGAAEEEENQGTLVVNFIDVGQGDSIFITQGESTMLIDAGENDCGTKVQSYIQSNNIKKLDYVIGTHPDSDHIGGLDVIIYKFDCQNILMPECSKDTKTYEEVIASADEKGYKINHPKAGDTFALGEAEVTVLSPGAGADYGDNYNDYSIAVKITYKDTSFLFTGDCEEAAEQDMLNAGYDLSADVMKAGHHGSDTSNTQEFLEAVKPETIVISCGEDNEYGHPRAEVLNNLRSLGINVFRTDEQGSIVAVSDGTDIVWNTSPSESWQAGEPKGSAAETKETESVENIPENENQENSTATYILNTNTMKIHYPSCSSVGKMSEQNKMETNKSVDELEAEGYVPCKICNP